MAVDALQSIRNCGTAISCDTVDPTVAKAHIGDKYINSTSNQGIVYNYLAANGLEHNEIVLEAARHFKHSDLPQKKKEYQVVYKIYALVGK